jgi:hypothetical protein
MSLFTLKNLGSAFVSTEQACGAVRANQAKGLATMAQLNACINQNSEQRQAAQRTMLLIGGVAVVALWMVMR